VRFSIKATRGVTANAKVLKLTDGQFENAKIKMQNAKLRYPPSADADFIDFFGLQNALLNKQWRKPCCALRQI